MLDKVRREVADAVWRQVRKWLEDKEVYLIFGPPGTGKTAAGGRLAFEGRVEVEGVELRINSVYPTAVYFNRSMADSAASRFKGAIRERYGLAKYTEHAIKTVDGLAVSLAIRLGYRLYAGQGLERCFKLEERLEPEVAIELLRACLTRAAGLPYSLDPYENPERGNEIFSDFDYFINTIPVPGSDGVDLLISALVEEGRLTPNEASVLRKYVEFLLRGGRVDFTLAKRLAFEGNLKYTIKHHKLGEVESDTVFIDEAQDLSPLMWLMVARAFPNAYNVVIAGDDDQTIYTSLHGAKPDILLRIAEALERGELKGHRPVVLKQSHRVAAPVAEVAKSVIAKLPNRWPKDWQGRDVVASVKKISIGEALSKIVEIYDQAAHQLRRSEIPEAFVLAPTNRIVLDLYYTLLAVGVLPSSLKRRLPYTIERMIKHYIETGETHVEVLKKMEVALKERGHDPKARIEKMFEMAKKGASPVVVDTAYTAKGLECHTAFLINSNTAASLEERIRLAYVALTRARENVYIVDAPATPWTPLWIPL
ncbi:MAG: AAA family ATPase [Thermoproteus sp.]